MYPPLFLTPTMTKTASHWHVPVSDNCTWHLTMKKTWVKSCYFNCYCQIPFVLYILCRPHDVVQWYLAKRNSSPNDSSEKKKKKETFVCDGAKKELTSKIIELLHPQWMEGTAKSCSWYLFASLICKISTQVSWAWSMESAELFSAKAKPQFLSCGKLDSAGGKGMWRNNSDVLFLSYCNHQILATYAHALSCSVRHSNPLPWYLAKSADMESGISLLRQVSTQEIALTQCNQTISSPQCILQMEVCFSGENPLSISWNGYQPLHCSSSCLLSFTWEWTNKKKNGSFHHNFKEIPLTQRPLYLPF